MDNKRNAVTYNITRGPYRGIQINVLLIRENIDTNVYLYYSTQRTSAIEERQADRIQLANVIGFCQALLYNLINLGNATVLYKRLLFV